jgi:hypothetical protein
MVETMSDAKHSIFFSWQSDTETMTGRNLVERALERAVAAIGMDTGVESVVREGLEIDRDTKGVAGSPPIVETIFKKIDGAAAFVADMTFAGKRPDGAPIPNPNVLIEYGWALKSLGHARIVSVMNTAFGNPSNEQLPFDMRHLRHPIQYHCPEGADEATRLKARNSLAKELERAIKDVIASDEFKASLPEPVKQPVFHKRDELGGPGRFRARGHALGVSDQSFLGNPSNDVRLEEGPVAWLRVMPTFDPGKRWKFIELKKAATNGFHLMPMASGVGSFDYIRAEDGFGVYATIHGSQGSTRWAVFAFDTGEVWAADSYVVGATASDALGHSNGKRGTIPLDEPSFATALQNYSTFLKRLGVEGPYRWIAGIDGIKSRGLWFGRSLFGNPRGERVVESVSASGTHAVGNSEVLSLKPFFEAIYDKCGLERPPYLDEASAAH